MTKMDIDNDSIMTEKGNTTQPLKTVQNQMPSTITYPIPTQQLKPEQKQARRLKTEQEAHRQTQEAQPWGATVWNRENRRDHYIVRNHPSFWGPIIPTPQTKGNYAKGGTPPQTWSNLRGILEGRPLLK